MLDCIAIGLGGSIGAVLRYLIGLIKTPENFVFPIKTFCINIAGCILIALVTFFISKNTSVSPRTVLFLKTGVCGGFTTFSTFALESSELIKNGHIIIALLYMFLSMAVGVGIIFMLDIFSRN